ncbi:MAG: hypothetical protein IPG59_13650 [Candidatus Melainabacteria bacterium]|nr:MAG: hypothetical protein IPG59_13650 [Candidatus Melainabacteria bacterium]
MSTTVQLILLGIGVIAALYFFVPAFKNMFQIRAGKAVDGLTTDVEKQELILKNLAKDVDANRIRVTNVTGDYRHQVNKMTELQAKATKAQGDYDISVDAKMPAEVQNEKFQDFQKAQAAVTAQRAVVDQFAEADKAAKKALTDSVKALEKVAAKVQNDAAKADLKKVFDSAAVAIEASNKVEGAFSELQQTSDKIDQELERSKARLDAAKGNENDQKFEDLAEQERLRREREAYDKQRNGGGDKA